MSKDPVLPDQSASDEHSTMANNQAWPVNATSNNIRSNEPSSPSTPDEPFTSAVIPTTPANHRSSIESLSPILSDSGFTATPLFTTSSGPNQCHNHAAIQRSASIVQEQASALSRQLSIKSNGSNGGHEVGSSINTAMGGDEGVRGYTKQIESSIGEESDCTITKSGSARSTRSIRGIGTIPIGKLRVVSPSPTRERLEERQPKPEEETHPVLKQGSVFVIRDIPVGVVFGYDTRSFTIKELGHFDGVKHLPPGAHLFWASSDITSLRTGYWIVVSKQTPEEYGDVFVRRWDNYSETLDDIGSKAEERIQKCSISEFIDNLHVYDLSANPTTKKAEIAVWQSLTSCMGGNYFSRLTGKPRNRWSISSTHDYKRPFDKDRENGMLFEDRKDEVLAFIFPKDSRTFSANTQGRERTEQATDTSSHVYAVIDSCEHFDQVVSELQFCFLTGMILGNSACQEHWVHVVKTVFKAYRLAMDGPTFFEKFIRAFHAQLMYNETGFEEGASILDIETDLRDDLKVILTIFKSRLTEQLLSRGSSLHPDQNAVGTAFEALESWLWRWNWDLRGNYVRKGNVQLEDGTVVEDLELTELEAEDERGEWAPQVVALDDEGREIGLISF